jgi:hypothetical protein
VKFPLPMTIPCESNDTNNGHDQPYLGRGQKISNNTSRDIFNFAPQSRLSSFALKRRAAS